MTARGRAAWLVLLSLLIAPTSALAQVVQVQAGSSSLFSAHGGSLELRSARTSTTIGAGLLGDRLTFGLLTRRATRVGIWSIGDDVVDFQLPSDVFGGSRYMPVRGAGLTLARGRTRIRVFGGTTSDTLGAPFFRGASTGAPAGMILVERLITSRVGVFTKTALSTQQTSIQGISWKPSRGVAVGLSGGVGSNRPYLAVGSVIDTRHLLVSAAFIDQRPGFRRLVAEGPTTAELDRGNLSATVRPTSWWSGTVARQTILEDSSATAARTRVDQVGSSLNVAGVRLGSSAFQSSGSRGTTRALSASIGRRLWGAFDATAEYFTSTSAHERASSSVVARLQEDVHPRLNLTQVVTRTGGQNTFNIGGEFISNPVRVSVTHQTLYAPLKPGNPFVHMVGIDLRLRLVDAVGLQGGTYLTPDGSVRYTVSAMLTHARADAAVPRDGRSRLERFVVRGRVQDAEGIPLPGAVIRIGDDVLITDASGRFLSRTARRRPLQIDVMLDEFVAPGRFRVVSAPSSVTPDVDGHSPETIIVVDRI